MTKKIYVDGSSNSVSSAICYTYFKGVKQKKFIKTVDKDSPVILEYKALLWALKEFEDYNGDIIFYSDCKRVVEEVNGIQRLHDATINLTLEVKLIIDQTNNRFKLEWISRDFNHAGIYLEERLKKVKLNILNVTKPIIRVKRTKHGIRVKRINRTSTKNL